ncbi:hypothetical protein L198_02240 [Cryptococcus wingfieldii CBS 7118]|uniref:Uncharacterized protein n=1 Tax=Cryptococcus wingfieldii CBS 7118 TaxID=1295528 RepID=A0A1E3JRE0_9TREE|nr:hypothetical protein L198_02240 [Cryptococcus wingfieldii CBS 7118]ODO03393.1 hypothetical protein L198_02240 [Cryptococcus wingfieldii CBS 7118]
MPLIRLRDSDSDAEAARPSSISSYFFPLLLIILACAGYMYWRRSTRPSAPGIPLNISGERPGIRLSEDGPPTHTFITNNLSSDSLPSHALSDLPELPESRDQYRDQPQQLHSSESSSASGSAYVDHPLESAAPGMPMTRFSAPKPGSGAPNPLITGASTRKPKSGGVKGMRRSQRGRAQGVAVEASDDDESGSDSGAEMSSSGRAIFDIGDDDDGPLGR